jgi:hypothetical protein
MQAKPAPFANVFGAFSSGLSGGGQQTSGSSEPIAFYRALSMLAEQPEGRMSFGLFGKYLPGDSVGTLSSALRLVKEGWIEFVGDVVETSDVRLTPAGRDLVDTMKSAGKSA